MTPAAIEQALALKLGRRVFSRTTYLSASSKNSAVMNHGIGPGPSWKQATNIKIKATASHEIRLALSAFSGSVGSNGPSVTPTAVIIAHMPISPPVCSGLRPNLSTIIKLKSSNSKIKQEFYLIPVKTILIIPTKTVQRPGSSTPARMKILVE